MAGQYNLSQFQGQLVQQLQISQRYSIELMTHCTVFAIKLMIKLHPDRTNNVQVCKQPQTQKSVSLIVFRFRSYCRCYKVIKQQYFLKSNHEIIVFYTKKPSIFIVHTPRIRPKNPKYRGCNFAYYQNTLFVTIVRSLWKKSSSKFSGQKSFFSLDTKR